MKNTVYIGCILFALYVIIACLNFPKGDKEIISIVAGVELENIKVKESIRCRNRCRAIFVEISDTDMRKIDMLYSNKWILLQSDDIFELNDDIEISNLSGSYTKGSGKFDGLPYIVRIANTNTIIIIIARAHY